MKTKLMAIFFAVASAVNADPSWRGQNGSGFIDDESMWSAADLFDHDCGGRAQLRAGLAGVGLGVNDVS